MTVSPGQPIPRSATLWNQIIESAEHFARQRRMGEASGSSPSAIPSSIIKIKNSSGAHVRMGEVLEIDGFLLGNVRRGELWFDGDAPNTTRPFVVAIQDIPTTSIDRAQILGACVALVNVTDAGHGYAVVADGEPVLQSAESGAVRILYKPTGTGEKTCAVLLGAEAGESPPGSSNRVAYTETQIPARSGTTPGGPISVQPLKLDTDAESETEGELIADGSTVSVYSWVNEASSDPSGLEGGKLYIFYEQDVYGTRWFTGQECPA